MSLEKEMCFRTRYAESFDACLLPRHGCRPGAGKSRARSGIAGNDPGRPGYVGLPTQRHARLLEAGKSDRQGIIEAFNGRFRAECLNAHWFLSLADAQEKLEDWRTYYNDERPHGTIHQKTPIMLLNHVGAASPPSKPEKSTLRRSKVRPQYRTIASRCIASPSLLGSYFVSRRLSVSEVLFLNRS